MVDGVLVVRHQHLVFIGSLRMPVSVQLRPAAPVVPVRDAHLLLARCLLMGRGVHVECRVFKHDRCHRKIEGMLKLLEQGRTQRGLQEERPHGGDVLLIRYLIVNYDLCLVELLSSFILAAIHLF